MSKEGRNALLRIVSFVGLSLLPLIYCLLMSWTPV